MDRERKFTPKGNDDSVFSKRLKAGKRRTYFFDVRSTRASDFFITLTESKKRFDGEGYERHKLHLYKEDFNRFVESLQEVIDYVKNELMPDYDFDEFERRERYYDEPTNESPVENILKLKVETENLPENEPDPEDKPNTEDEIDGDDLDLKWD